MTPTTEMPKAQRIQPSECSLLPNSDTVVRTVTMLRVTDRLLPNPNQWGIFAEVLQKR